MSQTLTLIPLKDAFAKLTRPQLHQMRAHHVRKLSTLEQKINRHRVRMLGIKPPPAHWTNDAATYRLSIAQIDALLRDEQDA